MILNQSEEYVFGSLGWVDGNAIWILECRSGRVSARTMSDAKYISLHEGANDLFSASHNYETDKFAVSVHRATESVDEVARFSIDESGISLEGDAEGWESVKKSYLSYFEYRGVSDYWLCLISGENKEVKIQRFDWYDDTYDKGYQGVIGVTDVPNSELVIVSVQRDSAPVLYNPFENKLIGKVTLAGRLGNPRLRFVGEGQELWADDYDTIVKIEPNTWKISQSICLQPEFEGTSAFIGEYWFNANETSCFVPRPFSGDVIEIDRTAMKIKSECKIGAQPLQAVVLSNGKVFARNWKDGALLTGTMKQKSRFWFF